MHFWERWSNEGTSLLFVFFLVYFIVFYLWGLLVLTFMIYVFTSDEDALPKLAADYAVVIGGWNMIIGFYLMFMIRAVQDNVQKREQRFQNIMQIIYNMLSEIAVLTMTLPAYDENKRTVSRRDIKSLLFTLIDLILEAEDMPELCSTHHTQQSDYMAWRHTTQIVRADIANNSAESPSKVFLLLADLKMEMVRATQYVSPDTSRTDLISSSEVRGVVLKKVWSHLKQLDERYATIPRTSREWAHDYALRVVDATIAAVVYIYLALRPIELLSLAVPGTGRMFVAAIYYAISTTVLLGIVIDNSWYELVYNGRAVTFLDAIIKMYSTPNPSYKSKESLYTASDSMDLWRRYARSLVLAGDSADYVARAISYTIKDETAYDIQSRRSHIIKS